MTPCFVSHPERDQGRGHELRSGARDRVKDVSDIERRGYDLVQACERLRAGGLLTRVSKQSVSFDRKRGLVGEAREQRDLIRAEEPPLLREDVQDADDPLVRPQRHAQEAVEAALDDRLLVARVVAGVYGQIGNDDRLPTHHDGSAQALAHGDSGARHDGGDRLRASADHQLVPVTQPKSRAFDGEQGRRRIHDQVEDLSALLYRGEAAHRVVEHCETTTLEIVCLVRGRAPGFHTALRRKSGAGPDQRQSNRLRRVSRPSKQRGTRSAISGCRRGPSLHMRVALTYRLGSTRS